jgi:hypothetical protein
MGIKSDLGLVASFYLSVSLILLVIMYYHGGGGGLKGYRCLTIIITKNRDKPKFKKC